MKSTKLLLATAIGLSLVSCKKDDKCEVSDWVGTYELTGTCGKNTLTFSTEGNSVVATNGDIKKTLTNGSDDCTKTIKLVNNNLSFSLSGDELTLKDTGEDGLTCTYTGKRKN